VTVLVFLLFAAVGVASMAPSVSFGDSGEFIASAAGLGIAHAPGYPLFSLAGHAIGCALPWACWGYRVNLLSALCGAAALALVFDATLLCGLGAVEAGLASLFLGLSPLWLHTSGQAEVFSMNSLAAAAAFWVFCRWRDRLFAQRPMALLGLCLGLGGANHHTLVLIVPSLLAAGWVRCRPRPAAGLRGVSWMLLFGGLGLALYLFLPLRSRLGPALDWGHPRDLARFLHVLLRRDYGSFALTVEGAAVGRLGAAWPQLIRWAAGLQHSFGPVGLVLAAAGAASWLRRAPGVPMCPGDRGRGTAPAEGRPELPWSLPLLWILLAGPGFLLLGNPPFDPVTSGALERFALLSWIPFAFLIAAGADQLWSLPAGLRRASLACLLLVPLAGAARAKTGWDQRWDLAAHDYGKNVLRSLPPGSVLYMDGGDDTFYTLAYFQFACGLRPDVEPHDRGGLVFPNPYGSDFRSLPREAKEARRREIEAASVRERPTLYSTLSDAILPGHILLQHGLLRRAVAGSTKTGMAEDPAGRALWDLYPLRVLPALGRAHYRYRALVPVYAVMRAASDRLQGRLLESLSRLEGALSSGEGVLWVPGAVSRESQWVGFEASGAGDWRTAERAYALAAKTSAREPGVWLNLGVSLEKLGRSAEAEAAHRRGLAVARESGPDAARDAAQAFYNLGSLYWAAKDWRRASEMFSEAARLSPGDAKTASLAREAARRAEAP